MGGKWLWGAGKIAPEHKDLSKQEYLEKLADTRERYLQKLLNNLSKQDIPHICRLEKARLLALAAWDRLSENAFSFQFSEDPGDMLKSMADIAAHLLTHEQKNADPEISEPLEHMAEHEEAHLRQIRARIARYGLMGK